MFSHSITIITSGIVCLHHHHPNCMVYIHGFHLLCYNLGNGWIQILYDIKIVEDNRMYIVGVIAVVCIINLLYWWHIKLEAKSCLCKIILWRDRMCIGVLYKINQNKVAILFTKVVRSACSLVHRCRQIVFCCETCVWM